MSMWEENQAQHCVLYVVSSTSFHHSLIIQNFSFPLIEGTPALPFLLSLLFSFAYSISKDRLPDYILKIAPSAAWIGNYLGKGKGSQSVQNSCLMFLKYDLYKEYSSLRKINYNMSSLLCSEPV